MFQKIEYAHSLQKGEMWEVFNKSDRNLKHVVRGQYGAPRSSTVGNTNNFSTFDARLT